MREHLQLWQFVAAAPSAEEAAAAMLKGKDGERSAAALRAVDMPTLQHTSANFLIHGSGKSGKTSLLFQRALAAAEAGKKAVFICPDKEKVHRRQPLLNGHIPKPKVSVLSRVEIRYLRSREELLAYLCHAHMERANVGFIGIDDFDSYWSKDIDNVGIARMCSYLANAADGLGCPAGIALSLGAPSPSGMGHSMRMALIRRWFPSVLSLSSVPLSPSETAQGARGMEQSHSRALPTAKRSRVAGEAEAEAGCRTELSLQLTRFHIATLVLYCLPTGINLVGAGTVEADAMPSPAGSV